MSRIVLGGAVFLLVAHGLIHLMGMAVYLRLADVRGLPYTTKIFNDTYDIGDSGIKVYGAAWGLAAAGFVLAALALSAQWTVWYPLLVGSSAWSAMLVTMRWRDAYVGAFFDLLVIVIATLLHGSPLFD